MRDKDLVLGKKYKLPHGTGKLLGYEIFTNNGYNSAVEYSLPNNPDYNGFRFAFKLDEGHNWPFHGEYFAYSREVEEIE